VIWVDNQEWKVYRSLEEEKCDNPVDFSDGDLAVQWARRFEGDEVALARFRSILGECPSGPFCDDDAGVLEQIANKLVSGELRVCARKWEFSGSTSAKGAEQTAPPFDPNERKKYQPDEPAPPESEESFPDSADLVAIAEVQRQAAAAGAPFCEECERARAAQGGGA